MTRNFLIAVVLEASEWQADFADCNITQIQFLAATKLDLSNVKKMVDPKEELAFEKPAFLASSYTPHPCRLIGRSIARS